MIDTQLSYFDAAVISIMLLSCLFAFFRGFVKEILSLGAWIGAGLVTLYFFGDVAEMLKPHFKNEMVAGGVAALGVYVISLIGFSIINSLIMRMMKEGSDVGILDNALGLIFGALRGAFIVSLGYFLLTIVMTEDTMPEWIQQAKTRPWVKEGAITLGRIAPEYLTEHTALIKDIKEKQEKGTLWPKSDEGDTDTGYEEEHKSEMDRFINNLTQDHAS